MEDEDVLVMSSPLYEHLKMAGLAEQLNVVELPPHSHTDSALDDVHLTPQEKNPKSQGFVHFLIDSDEIEHWFKQEVLNCLLSSSSLLEDHLINLHSWLENFHEDYLASTKLVSNFRYKLFVTAGIMPAISLCVRTRCDWLTSTLTGILIGVGIGSALVLVKSWIKRSLVAVVERMRKLVRDCEKEQVLWRRCFTFCQEIALISRGAVLINRHTSDAKEQISFPLRECLGSYMVRQLDILRKDLRIMRSIVQSSPYTVQPAVLVSSTTIEEEFSLSHLQDLRRQYTELRSLWILNLSFMLVTQSADHFIKSFQRLGEFEYPVYIERLHNYHKDLLDGNFEEDVSQKVQIYTAKHDLSLTLHSLYLHARELFRLCKSIDSREELTKETSEVIDEIRHQINSCLICIESAEKLHGVMERKICEKLEMTTDLVDAHTDECTQSGTTDSAPITDQVFECSTDSADQLDENAYVDVGEDQLIKRDFEKYLMQELKGVINELAKERQERENKLAGGSNLGSEQLAQITWRIVESRDFHNLLHKHSPGLQQTEESSVNCPPRRKVNTYEADIESKEVSEKVKNMDMKEIAKMVASRFQDLSTTESFDG